jgi:K+-sensing histidine kinase KdpD
MPDDIKSRAVESARVERPSQSDHSAAGIGLSKMTLLFNASKALASTTDIDELLNTIAGEVRNVLGCEGTGVVLYDEENDDFYWRSVQDEGSLLSSAREEIRIPRDKGVAAWVFDNRKPALVNDAANDPRIYRKVEDKSGFTTRNMICVPLRTPDTALGVLYALNKDAGDFTDEDVEILAALSGNIALALENAARYEALTKSYRELERLNRVKNKMLNHLSHELKTPLAIIEASLRILTRRMEAEGLVSERFPVDRIQRNLERLKVIEKQVSHIVEEKAHPERDSYLGFIENLRELIEISKEDEPWLSDALTALNKKIWEIFPVRKSEKEGVSVLAAFQAVEARVRRMTEDRTLDIRIVPPEPAYIKMQPQILMASLGGIIRNAVENTPDHGRIDISAGHTDEGYEIRVKDYGVGIPESEQPNIFEGFYPVQETDMYSSGKRYAFNAGGTGTDLLKIRIFSERFGFKVRFTGTRCSCIPTPADICPGDITACGWCNSIEDCLKNGGTEFVIQIPSELVTLPGKGEAVA